MKNIINWLKKEESGQGMVEYGLIIAGIAIVVMLVIFTLAARLKHSSSRSPASLPGTPLDLFSFFK